MQNLVWIGNPFFAGDLQGCGWEKVYIHNFEDKRIYGWQDILDLCGFQPDVLVVADKSRPPFVLGMENFPCLTVFYAVDSHIHAWYPFYGQGFDACLVSLGDHLQKFRGPYLGEDRIFWSPPYARDEDKPDPSVQPEWDCLFVGNVDAGAMPGRARFLRELEQRIPGLQIKSGNYQKLFPKGKILLNQAIDGDLNFRVFEAMGCGGCLVTPRIKHGFDRLFVDGEHLVAYAPDDPGDAAYRINFLLEHPDIVSYIQKTGLAEIDAKHRARHRAESFTDRLCDLYLYDINEIIRRRKNNADKIIKDFLAPTYLLWANELADEKLKTSYLKAARGELEKPA